jgi:hypothetical protein
VTVAGVGVFFWFDALPFQDLPAHAGLIALRHRLASSAFERRFFVFAPQLGPYSLFRFLGEEFDVVGGPVAAVRTLAALPVVATPIALVWARRRLHGDDTPTAGFYALALSFGFMTLLGFASYELGVALLVVALTAWLELLAAVDRGDPKARRYELAVLGLAPLVLVAHGHAFVLFGLLAGVAALSTGRRLARVLRGRALVPAVALAGWAEWTQRASVVPAGSAPIRPVGFAMHFQGVLDKLSLLVTPTLMTRIGLDILVGVVVWVVVVAAVVTTGRSLAHEHDTSAAHSRALVACAAVLALVFLALPHTVGWFGFVDGRLVPLVLFLGLMAVRRPALGQRLASAFDRLGEGAAWAMVAIALFASYRFQREAAGWREILADVPARARLLNLPLDPNSDVFTAHPFVHYDKLALADRPIVPSDVWFHQGTAIYPTAGNPSLRLPASYSESDLRVIDWPAYDLSDWDFVLIRTRPGAAEPGSPGALILADHRGGWWLYRRR